MTYKELNEVVQNKLTKVYKDNQLFFAFNQEQLKEGRKENNILKDVVLVSIGVGGCLPKENMKSYTKDVADLLKWRKEQMSRLGAQELENAIHYELSNFECWYTGDISVVYGLFPEVAKAEIKKVYTKFAGVHIN